jgi:hypothetical protein
MRDIDKPETNCNQITPKAKFDLANRILLDRELSPAARLVGWYLADHLNNRRGYAWPPQEQIAADLGICERSVRYAIEQLEGRHFDIDRSNRQHEYRPRTTPADFAAIDDDDTGKIFHDTGKGCTPKPAKDVPPSLENLLHPRIESPESKKGGTEKARKQASSDASCFEDFWKAKPSRKGSNPKHHARLKFDVAVKAGADPQQIVAAAKQWATSETKNIGTEYVAMAATWLHQRRFEDYQAPPTSVAQTGFLAPPHSPQFVAWLAWARDTDKQSMVRELLARQEEGRGFDFESEWPTGHTVAA